MKKTLLLSLVCQLLWFSCASHKGVPTAILNVDINNTLLAKDLAAEKSLDDMLSELLAKVALVELSTAQSIVQLNTINGKTFYCDYLKAIEAEEFALAQMAQAQKLGLSYYQYYAKAGSEGITFYDDLKTRESDKKKRNKILTKFVESYDAQSHGDLNCALTVMKQKSLQQETDVFESFFALLDHLKNNKTPYHVVLRSFGKEIDYVADVLSKKLAVNFVKARFIKDNLNILATSSTIAASIVEKTLTDPQEIENFINETPYLAIQDEYGPWGSSDEDWHHGKIFFSATKNSKNEAILPIFLDDNIEPNFLKNNIVRPVKIEGSKLVLDDNPQALIDSQVFRVETVFAMLNKRYFIELVETALEAYAKN